MLMRTDSGRDFDRLTQELFGARTRPQVMSMDAYREGDRFVVHFDLPGVDPDSIDLTVERSVLAVSAQRQWDISDDQQVVISERPQGTFSRELFLGEGLDHDSVEASYRNGVLTIMIPVAEQAKPRKIQISGGDAKAEAIETGSSES
jgi:HSP20 family protein